MSDLEIARRRSERERAARKEAESLLEKKSLDLFEANQQLRDLAERTRIIVETAAEGIVSYTQDGSITAFNRSAQKIFRRTSAVGMNIRDLFGLTEEDASALLWPETDRSDAGEMEIPAPVEVTGIRKTGEEFASEVAISRANIGPKLIYTAIIRDNSRRKKLEGQLQQAKKMESVGQLAAGIAHEINTPIQFIGSNIQFLQGAFLDLGELLDLFDQLVAAVREGSPTDVLLKQIDTQSELADLPFLREEFPGAISQSMEGIDRVATIVRAMKEFAKPPSESKNSTDINQAIENVLAVSTNQYRDIAKIETTLSPDLDSVVCLGGQINQVFLNLLANAAEAIADHCEPGAGSIHVLTRQHNDRIEIQIQDNGPGIPPEIQNRIFDPFFTTKEVGKGMGQGLAFVYDVVVNKHAGSVQVQSLDGGGTAFVVTLPLATAPQTQGYNHAHTVS